jgi:hypothetical protein
VTFSGSACGQTWSPHAHEQSCSPAAYSCDAQKDIVSGRRVFCKIQVDNLANVTEVRLAWRVGYGSNQARLMTRLRVSVATGIGHAAAVIGGHWGAVSQRAAAVGCSREAMYQQSRRVAPAVAREQTGGPSDDALCNEHTR